VLAAAHGIAGDGDLPDAQVEALRAAFGEQVLTELLLVCSIYVGLARFLHVARVDVEDDYLPELREFPLPPA
jgi:alkylhydroperoxidase family enzyme